MFADTMSAAIDAARTLTRLDHLSRAIWQGHGAEAIGDDHAQNLAERLHARKAVVRGEVRPVGTQRPRPGAIIAVRGRTHATPVR
jgi:hypothetical protein